MNYIPDMEQKITDLTAERDELRQQNHELAGALDAARKLLRLIGTTWTDESDAHIKAHKVADMADVALAKVGRAAL